MKESGSPLGVCVLPEWPNNAARTVVCPAYMHEMLRHAGLCYEDVAFDALGAALPRLRVLVTVGQADLPEAARDALSIKANVPFSF